MSGKEYKAIGQNWQVILAELVEEAEQVAQTVERVGKFAVKSLVQTLVLSCMESPEASLQQMVQVADAIGVKVAKSSLHERITPRLVMLLAVLLELSLKRVVATPTNLVARLQALEGLDIVDSTQLTVCPALYETFCGSGGIAKLKVHVVLDYLRGSVRMVETVAGRQPDQACPLWAKLLQPNRLYLFDLGYFKQETLRDLDQAHAFFVTRCQSQVGLYDPTTLAPVDLSQILKRQRGEQFEDTFRLGSRVKTPVRVVAHRLVSEVAAARRRHAKQKAKEQGQTCRAAYLIWLGWEILVTNLPPAWSADDLWVLYGVRWQIEIVFKVWKSQLGLAQLGPWRPARVMAQFYAHLVGAILCHHAVAPLRWQPHTCTSLAKAVTVIRHHLPALYPVIRHHWRGLTPWAHRLRAAFLAFAQSDKRKTRPTTMQSLMDWA